MPRTFQTEYQSISNMDPEVRHVSGKTFYVYCAGKTNGAERQIVAQLKATGQIESTSTENSDYLVVFCPVSSQVGTDIKDALDNVRDDKAVILVVMHHTFDRNHVISESRRQVDKSNVILTVDYLFYEDKILDCPRNDIALFDIKKTLGVPNSQLSPFFQFPAGCRNLSGETFYVYCAGKTNGAERQIVAQLKATGQIEVNSTENSDYLVVFCPVSSRVGTDIKDALDNVKDDKAVILVVMHHTFDHNHVISESRRQVDKSNVILTVDYLFYEDKILDCSRNDIALFDIKKTLGVPHFQLSLFSQFCARCRNWISNCWNVIVSLFF